MELNMIKENYVSEESEKLETLKAQELKEQLQFQQQINQLESLVKKYLTKEAWLRYNNIKFAHIENAVKILAFLGQLIQYGKLNELIDDNEFKKIIKQINEPKKQFRFLKK